MDTIGVDLHKRETQLCIGQADGLWEASFAKQPGALEQLADEALQEHRAGRTRPLEPDKL